MKRKNKMARAAGSKIVTCPNVKCGSRICGIPGESILCKKCGTKVRLTKAVLAAESEKKGGATVAPKAVKKIEKKIEKKVEKKSKKMPVAEPVKRGRRAKAA
jgi:hypothetical protein